MIFAFILAIVPLMLLVERKLLGRFQARYGPNRVGPYGLMQPLADVLKLLSKEQSHPGHRGAVDDGAGAGDHRRHRRGHAGDHPVRPRRAPGAATSGLYGIDVPIGLLYFFAFGSLGLLRLRARRLGVGLASTRSWAPCARPRS